MFLLRPAFVSLLGAVLIIMGFLYDLSFAGIPYQDPLPDVQADWRYHSGIADDAILAGVLIFLVGCIWGAARWMASILKWLRPE